MFAIFAQTTDGLVWLANAATAADAQGQIDAGDFNERGFDAVFIAPLAGFKQFD